MMKSQRRRDENGVRQQRQRQKNNHDRRRMNSITATTTNGNNNRGGIRLSRSCCCHRGKLGLAMHFIAAFTAVSSTCTRIGVAKALSTTTNKSTSTTLLRAACSNNLPLTVAAVTNGRRRRQQHLSRSRTTRLNLFFNQRDENGNIIKSSQKSRGGKRGRIRQQPFITSETLEELRSSPGITFPMEVRLFNNDDDNDDDAVEEYDGDAYNDDNHDNRKSLLLRFMTTDDLKSLVPMCVEEFGNHGSNTQQQQLQLHQTSNILKMIPWYNNNNPPQKSIPDLWDGFCFEQLISWTLRLKLMQGNNNNNSIDDSLSENNNSSIKKKMIINDPVMLVLCERRQRRQQKNHRHPQQHPATTSTDNNDDDSSTATTATTMMTTTTTEEEAVAVENNDVGHDERIVGMVELSLQPPNADRNPPALPLPKWIKSQLASLTQIGSLQGWVTNLLIDSSCRGLGYSKVLMAATEGIAKHAWDCNYLFLHADADVTSGKIPQSLYNNLGYDLVKGSTLKSEGSGNGNEQQQQQQQKLSLEDEFAWAAAAGQNLERFAAIRMVDDVALLCFSKKL
jgi:GNAT superfamily N-acetyltransferase